MRRTKRYLARLLALIAIAAVAVAIVVIVSGFKDESKDSKGNGKSHPAQKHEARPKTTAKTYTVKSGDTLTAISRKTGVPIAQLLALNPETDPQILIAGNTLKLK